MPELIILWAVVIPAVPIIFGAGNVVLVLMSVALALCAFGLWLERERPGEAMTTIPQRNNVAPRHLPVAA